MTLPVDITATYPDDLLDPSRLAHQQHHDTIHAAINELPATYVGKSDMPINVVSDYGTTWSSVTLAIADGAAQGRAVYLPKRTWAADATIDVPSGMHLFGDGSFTRINHDFDGPLFNGLGSIAADRTISVATAVGATTLTVNDTSGYAPDTLVVIADPTQPVYGEGAHILQGLTGEVMRVKEITSATTLTLRGRLEFAYTTAATMRRITPKRDITFRDMHLVNPSPLTKSTLARGIALTYCRDVEISGIKMTDYDSVGVYLHSVYDFDVDRLSLQDFHDEGGNNPYGVLVAGCSTNGLVSRVRGRNGRHLFTTASTDHLPVVAHVRVQDCIGTEFTQATFDTHPGSRYITFADCEAYGGLSHGFQIRGTDTSIMNPVVAQVAGDGIKVTGGADRTYIRGGRLAGCGRGVSVDSSDAAVIKGLHILSPVTSGVVIEETNPGWVGQTQTLDLADVTITGDPSGYAFDFTKWNDRFRLGQLEAPDATRPVRGSTTTPAVLGRAQDGLTGGVSPSLSAGVQNALTAVANQAHLGRFVPQRNMVVTSLSFVVTTAAGSNDDSDLGIYSMSATAATLTRLVSTGTVSGLLNSLGVKTVSITPTRLVAGTVYYIAHACGAVGTTAAALGGAGPNNQTGSTLLGTDVPQLLCARKATAYPLPASIGGPSSVANAVKIGLLT